MNNDDRILALKQTIDEKKASLQKISRFAPETNCKLKLDGYDSNLHVMNKEELTFLLVKLNMYSDTASKLGVLKDFKISGFMVEDWIKDIKSKLDIIKYKEENIKLKSMEDKLTSLLSNDKQTELEIDNIEQMLNM